MALSQSIDSLPNTSYVTIRRFKSVGIDTYFDLLNFFPFRYENYSLISPIAQVQDGEHVTVQGTVLESENIFTRTGLKIQKIILKDGSGTIELNWFNQPYLIKLLHPGVSISISGETKQVGKKIILLPKEYEFFTEPDQTKHTGRFVPIYSEKKGLSSKTIREKVWAVLKDFHTPEILPEKIIADNNLMDEESAYRQVHFPETLSDIKQARERLGFDELFCMQLAAKRVRIAWEKETVGHRFTIDAIVRKKIDLFIRTVPFFLTSAQKKVFSEILRDLEQTKPMNRFLQGEVGSGKTVIAVLAGYCTFLNGFKTLCMAPTEILAEQHFKTFKQLFASSPVKTILITGAKKPTQKQIEDAHIIIGTHALIQQKRSFKKIGLVVIDEQHRFGVAQRAELKSKGLNPHLLTMTATPIPRTVMLTLYGELDISILDEMPKGRLPIKTYLVPRQKRQSCYEWIQKQIILNHVQAYIICPLIEESETETLQSVRAATKEYEYLKNNIFKKFRLGLLHGKLGSKEKNRVMNTFKNKKYDILVATPVVEVGIDIPSATIMIIEGTERFGLSQLHQLRGRIGRGSKQSYCFVFSEKEDPNSTRRLSYFTKTLDGNALAQKDLEIRGPGNLYGVEQHGYLELKIASLLDYPLIEKTRKAVNYFIEHYTIENYLELKKRVEESKIRRIARD